jgi:glutathione synthase/RimK-type ligase-like ATP-grasp enzyme
MNKLIKQFLRFSYTLSKISLIGFVKNYNSKSKVVLLIPRHWLKPAIEPFIWEVSMISYFIQNKISFRISFSLNPNAYNNDILFWCPGPHFFNNNCDYSSKLVNFAKSVENQDNQINPSSFQVSFLENKTFMYKQFMNKKIIHPKTKLFEKNKFDKMIPFDFPFLFKGEHSNSGKEVILIANNDDWSIFLESKLFNISNNLIFQKLINMRSDIRVVVVDDQVVNHYWRKNPFDEWRPTSTNFGSYLDFSDLPKNVIDASILNLKKLGLNIGAYDITFENDDINSNPIFLEVSPLFSLNPMVKGIKIDDYSNFKKKLFGKNVFWKHQVDQIFIISSKYLNLYKLTN